MNIPQAAEMIINLELSILILFFYAGILNMG